MHLAVPKWSAHDLQSKIQQDKAGEPVISVMLQSNQSTEGFVVDSTTEHIATVVSQVLRDYDVSRAYLFGSFARGEQNDECL